MYNFKLKRGMNTSQLPNGIGSIMTNTQIGQLLNGVEGDITIHNNGIVDVKNGSIKFDDESIELLFGEVDNSNVEINDCEIDLTHFNVNKLSDYDDDEVINTQIQLLNNKYLNQSIKECGYIQCGLFEGDLHLSKHIRSVYSYNLTLNEDSNGIMSKKDFVDGFDFDAFDYTINHQSNNFNFIIRGASFNDCYFEVDDIDGSFIEFSLHPSTKKGHNINLL